MSLRGSAMFRRRPRLSTDLSSHLLFFGAILGCLALDQVTKCWVVGNLPIYKPVDAFPWLSPILSFTVVKNTGVVFGLFPGLGSLSTLLSSLVIVGILAFRRTLPSGELWVHASLGLATGGAVGNFADRVLRGFVVDFFDMNLWPFSEWPVFNVADSAIVVGVLVLLVDSFLAEREGLPIGV